jgi:hypothetical protein
LPQSGEFRSIQPQQFDVAGEIVGPMTGQSTLPFCP